MSRDVIEKGLKTLKNFSFHYHFQAQSQLSISSLVLFWQYYVRCEINRHTNSNELFNDNVTLGSFENVIEFYSYILF